MKKVIFRIRESPRFRGLILKQFFLSLFFISSSFGNEFPKLREPNFRPMVMDYFPEGSPSHIVYYVPSECDEEKAVKECFFYQNGSLKEEVDLKDDKYHGASITYYQSGEIAKLVHYENGFLEGEIKTFYPNGELKEKGYYSAGKKEGKFELFFADGTRQESGVYKNGKKTGEYLTFYEDGSKAAQIHYEKGLPIGDAFEWYLGGHQIKKTSHYVDGLLHNVDKKSAVIIYDEKGKIVEVHNYRLGKRIGGTPTKKKEKVVYVKDVEDTFKKEKILEDGEHESYFPDGSLKEIICFVNGKPHGEHREYHQETGNLYRHFHYVYGQFEGEQYVYYPDGSMAGLITYKNGVLHGKKNKWNRSQELVEEGEYCDGYLSGRYSQKNEIGEECITYYKEGKKEGYHQIFYPNKVKKFEATFSDNKLDGEVIEYSEKGFKIASYKYQNGKKDGEALLYNDNGSCLSIIPYKNGQKEGRAFFYYPDGQIFKEISYKNGLRTGLEKTFYEQGELASSYSYRDDKLDGLCQEWSKGGILIFEGEYQLGMKHGRFNKYDPKSGEITLISEYSKDNCLSRNKTSR